MTQLVEPPHVEGLISDYVLGLLPGNQANWVAAHTSHCAACRRALAQEQEICRSVKTTLSTATIPERDRLRRLMPPAPSRARGSLPRLSPRLAATGIMFLVLFSAIAFLSSQRPGAWGISSPTALSTAVMLTDTPTQTATRGVTATAESLQAASSPAPAVQTAAGGQAIVPAPALVPVPAAPMLQ
jgi:anti-sigma factor RsiW